MLFRSLEAKAGTSTRAARCKSIVAELASQHILILERDDGFGKRYAFIEDAVPSYLWFLAQQQTFREDDTATPQRVRVR